MASAAYFVKLGGALGDIGESKFGFYAPDDAYDDIGDELGVKKLETNDDRKGVLFGANFPKPPKVRINYSDFELFGDDRGRSCLRYCDPDKIGQVLNGSINDKKVTVRGASAKIRSVSMPG